MRVSNQADYLQYRMDMLRRQSAAQGSDGLDDPSQPERSAVGAGDRLANRMTGLSQARRNAIDGVSMIQTAQTGVDEISGALDRMEELVELREDPDLTEDERLQLEEEFADLAGQIDATIESTAHDDQKLLSATDGGEVLIHHGDGAMSTTVDLDVSAARGLTLKDNDNVLADIEAARQAVSSAGEQLESTQDRVATVLDQLNRIAPDQPEPAEVETDQPTPPTGADQAPESADPLTRLAEQEYDRFAEMVIELSKLQVLSQTGLATLSQNGKSHNDIMNLLA
jgi:flagellin